MRNVRAARIAGFGLTSADAARLTEFYVTAFGARLVSVEYLTEAQLGRPGVHGGTLRHTLTLGREWVEVLQFDTPGRPYADPLLPYDTAFQHFAVVVRDMDLALSKLQRTDGWKAISSGGPQTLPQQSGGVTAFKFQDPDGHPLELLAFPEHTAPRHWQERSSGGIFLGIDHSAISVRDTAISIEFYRTLGFVVINRTFNQGEAQANLDGIPNPQVEVTALSLDASTPHLELLCYLSEVHPPRQVLSSNDLAATRIVLAADGGNYGIDGKQQLLIDPDGHHLLLAP